MEKNEVEKRAAEVLKQVYGDQIENIPELAREVANELEKEESESK